MDVTKLRQAERLQIEADNGDTDDGLNDSKLKCEINNFVWMYADSRTTLGQADDIALKIFSLLRQSEHEHGEK